MAKDKKRETTKKVLKDPKVASEEIKVEKTETEEIDKEGLVTKRTKCEVYSRVVGFVAPVQQWNEGKQAEFEQRKTFKILKDKKPKKDS